MTPRPILIDCDPGIDDAIAIALAVAGPELELVGVTTTFGNVGVDRTTENALRVLEWLGSPVPVHPGATRSLLGPTVDAAAYHGRSGLEAPELGPSSRAAEATHAVTHLTESLLRSTRPATIVALGPLTNLALAIRLEPRITRGIERIMIMGGSTDFGNDSPAAEFNFLADPHAAQIVLDAGVPISLFGLNVTHELIATPERVARLRAVGTRSSRIVADMVEFFEKVYLDRYGFAGAALHDPCTVAALLDPAMFTMRSMRVDVDTAPGISWGRGVYDIWGLSGRPANADVAVGVDADAFFELLEERISRLP